VVHPTDYDSEGMKAGSSSNDQRRALVAAPDGAHWPARTQTQPEILKITPRPIDLAYALRRRWGWALGLGILAAAATAAAAWFLIPVNFTATAWLRIASSKPSIIFKVGGEDELLNDKRAQATLMTSRFVLSEALRKPGVSQLGYLRNEEDRLTWLKQNIQVSFPGSSEILQIAMTGDDPSQLVTLVNAVKDAYMQEVVGVDRENHLRRKSNLERSYERNKELIKKKSSQYKDLADQLGASGSDAVRIKELYAVETVSMLRNRVTGLQSQIRGLERSITIKEEQVKSLTDEPVDEEKQKELARKRMFEAYIAREPWITNARNQIFALDAAKFEEKQRAVREDAPSILRMEERIKTLQEGIAKRAEEIQPQLLEQIDKQIEEQLARHPAGTPTGHDPRYQDTEVGAGSGAERDRRGFQEERRGGGGTRRELG